MVDDEDAEHQQGNGADLHERAQVVPGRQQQPHRKDGRGKPVDGDRKDELLARQAEIGANRRVGMVEGLAEDDARHQAEDADHRRFHDLALPPDVHVEAHEDGERDGHRDGERAPLALGQGIDDHDAQPGDGDDDDEEDGDRAGEPRDRADFVASDFREGATASSDRRPQDDEVVDRSGQDASGDQPQKARRVTKLRGQRRTNEGAGPRDGGEVVPEKHPFRRGIVVVSVVLRVRRCHPRIVQRHDFRGDERAVVAIADHENANGRQDQIQSVHIGTG
jgi:hypothetical protein